MAEDFLEELEDELDQLEDNSAAPKEMFEHHRFVVEKGQTMVRIDKFLVNIMPDISRNRIQDAAAANAILVNDKPVKSSYRIKPHDVISIQMAYPPNEFEIIPQDIPINIVFEDADIILVNKSPGLVVHPGFGNFEGTLLNALAWHMKDNENFDVNNPNIGLVHRIDKDTSGLLLIAKNEDAKTKLGKQFFDKTTHRRYVALVWGTVEKDNGTIIGNIARDPKDRMQMAVFPPESEIGKHAVTHYTVLERLAYVTLVECRLETGRTHQIRAHMKSIGHTLFNDARYGGHEALRGTTFAKYKQFVNNCFELCPRQALHAKELGFVHPTSGEMMFFNSDIPADMQALIDKWRNYAAGIDLE